MYVPLYILAGLAFVGGWVGVPAALGGANHFHHWLAPVLEPAGLEAVKHAASMVGDLQIDAAATIGAAHVLVVNLDLDAGVLRRLN